MKNRIQSLLLVLALLLFPLTSFSANDAQTFPQKTLPATTSAAVPKSVSSIPPQSSWLAGFNKGAIQQEDKQEDKHIVSGGGRLFLGLMAVIGLIFGLAFMVKKMGYPGISRGDRIKIINVLAVGNKEKLMLVKVYGKYLLLGVTPHSINQLTELDPEEVEYLVEEQSKTSQNPPNWINSLMVNLLKIKKPNQSADHLIQGKDAKESDGKKFSDYVKSASQSSSGKS